MMIAPGKHSLSVIYHVVNATKNLEKDVTITINPFTYEGGHHYRVPGNLGDLGPNTDGDHEASIDGGELVEMFDFTSYTKKYYMWDAAENYWSGHEWDSAEPWQPKGNGSNQNYPKSNADARWYHESSGAFEASVNPLFSKLPNANEMAWYVVKGDAHWDNSTQWKAFGKTYTSGLWLKKLSVIAQENNKQLADLKNKNHEGVDMRTTSNEYSISPKSGKPKDSEISKYFFLPAWGYCRNGQIDNFGSHGTYWSASASPSNSSSAYTLCFNSDFVAVHNGHSRDDGYVAQPFE